jgi:hypothetical protein
MTLLIFAMRDEDGWPVPGRGRLHVKKASGGEAIVHGTPDSNGQVSFLFDDSWTPRLLRFTPTPPGFWNVSVKAPASGSSVCCEHLPSPNNGNWWWHEALNFSVPKAEAGKGVKVGVIDTAFVRGAGLDHVRFITHTGHPAPQASGLSEPIPVHGEIVCRIIGQQALSPNCCYGLAPGAELTAVAVDMGGKLDFNHTVEAVLCLARDWGADLVNISAGLFDNPLLSLRSVIREAARLGTLCIVAAGNEPVEGVAFPARYPECVAVGAIGLVGWGSDSSNVRRYGELRIETGTRGTLPDGRTIFHFPLSAWGEGLNLIAPGVGILINRGASPLFAATGTSYAAPMTCGLLAAMLGSDTEYLELPRSKQRYDRALALLRSLCVPTGLASKYEGWGLPRA